MRPLGLILAFTIVFEAEDGSYVAVEVIAHLSSCTVLSKPFNAPPSVNFLHSRQSISAANPFARPRRWMPTRSCTTDKPRFSTTTRIHQTQVAATSWTDQNFIKLAPETTTTSSSSSTLEHSSQMSLLQSFSTLLRAFSLASVLTVSSLTGLLYSYQGKLIYPAALPSGARQDQTRPSQYGLPFEELWLKTPDGEKLHAWYIRMDKRSERGPLTVVLFQANAGNIAHRLPLAAILLNQLRCNVFMLSYRGYGLSTGQPTEKGIKVDAQVALDWVKANLYGAEGHRIVLYGQSLGGAVAIDAAVRNAAWISALLLENTFLDIPSLIPSVLPPARFLTFLCTEIWSSITRLPLLSPNTVRVLFLSGGKDELVPPSHMKELHKLCSASVKEWKEFQDGTHNDTCMKV